MLLSILAVNRFACFNPFHRIDPVFGLNWTVNGQYETPPKNRPQAIATPSICPCSVLNCSRPNSDQYRRSLRIPSRQPPTITNNEDFLRKKFGSSHYDRDYDKFVRNRTSLLPGKPLSYTIKIPVLVRSEKLQLM